MCKDRTTCQCVLCKAERERAKRQVRGVIVPKEQREAREQEAGHEQATS